MDIKERIDALTETEAKAALAWVLHKIAIYGSCSVCDKYQTCDRVNNYCEMEFLRQALKEVRK